MQSQIQTPARGAAASHCIILCAGIATPPIEPYTQHMPKCFLPIAGQPILHHIVKMFVNQGISSFTVVIGAHAQFFSEEVRKDLRALGGASPSSSDADEALDIEFVENTFFWNNGPADSLRLGYTHFREKMDSFHLLGEQDGKTSSNKSMKPSSNKSFFRNVYVCYGDTVFTDVALRKLVSASATNALLVDRSSTTGLGAGVSCCSGGAAGVPLLGSPQDGISSSRSASKDACLSGGGQNKGNYEGSGGGGVSSTSANNSNLGTNGNGNVGAGGTGIISAGATTTTAAAVSGGSSRGPSPTTSSPLAGGTQYGGLFNLPRGAKSRETGVGELELCSVVSTKEGVKVIDQIGKNLLSRGVEPFGEFTGLFRAKLSTMDRLVQFKQDGSSATGSTNILQMNMVSGERFVPDLLRKAAPGEFSAVAIFGNRREIHSSQDLLQANSELCYLSDQDGRREYIKAIGSRLLAEANDLKRPVDVIAQELNFPEGLLDELLNGNVELETAQEILRRVNTNYPVSLNALWVEPDDCFHGIRVCRATQSEVSKRVLNRINKDGFRTAYYEYRDCAMSRLGPFRPEWIRELRCVRDSDPNNPDVAFNNGHLLFQSTFFIGPVNFYYMEPDGTKRCCEMNTGDSNWIAPFVPHSFTNRGAPDEFACIIACTYGAGIVNCLQSIGSLHPSLEKYSGDMRHPVSHFRANLLRYAQNDCFSSLDDLATRLLEKEVADGDTSAANDLGFMTLSASGQPLTEVLVKEVVLGHDDPSRTPAREISTNAPSSTAGISSSSERETALAARAEPSDVDYERSYFPRLPTFEECRILARELHCLPEDLYVSEEGLRLPVEVSRRGQGAKRRQGNCFYERLACSEHHSMIKSFDVEIHPSDQHTTACREDSTWSQIAVHQFGYNYSETELQLYHHIGSWVDDHVDKNSFRSHGEGRRIMQSIQPGDSFYIQPGVKYSFDIEPPETTAEDGKTKGLEDGSKKSTDHNTKAARIYLVRIPGHLTRELMREVSLCDQRGKPRIGNETRRWYS
ncbi:unnamed protein product [Amoebophrya sp. A25]|nr:unnamed protein product [Amoebophrya sp. A25]|eukprot:GSA25T00014547001.1